MSSFNIDEEWANYLNDCTSDTRCCPKEKLTEVKKPLNNIKIINI